MDELVAAVLGDTRFAAGALESLRAPESAAAQQLVAAFPELAALAHPAPPQVEHDAGTDRPLLDHVATRMLGQRLAALESGEKWPELSAAAFAGLASTARAVLGAGLGPALRAAILHLDIAKTTSEPHRAAWSARGIALDIHNEAAAAILRASDRTWGLSPPLAQLAIAWVEAHGLAGQHVRGEGPLAMLAPFCTAARELHALAFDGLHVINACDTAAVRAGLCDDALLAELARVRDRLRDGALAEPALDRARLAARLRALRAGRQRDGEPHDTVDAAVSALGDTEFAALAPALATCQLWYCEAATSALTPAAQLKVLAAAVGAARTHGLEVARPWHAQLRPLVGKLAGYRLRLVETALAQRSIRELLAGGANLGPLGALTARLSAGADPDAIVLDYTDSAESAALVTLLGIYETRSSAAFHQMLKALCDLYGLRKDDFDRVANEASYLASMNAARGDKQRMLDHVRPGKIVEIGPGGGVVLDLLEARFERSEIIGVDLSREVIAALEARAKAGRHRWRVVLGAAEALSELVGAGTVDTVVCCSILHEVFSYTPPRFAIDSVARVVRAAFAALRPGGRLVIRDGVMPPPATRRLRFIAPDARATFELYVAQFEGRRIEFRALEPETGGADRIELSAADAMEFLYTYTWGPASFPYEVREQYGVLPYDDYVAAIVGWAGAAHVVDLPRDQRSYLQPGYRDHLAGKIELTDDHDVPVELPDSNCLIVVEKT